MRKQDATRKGWSMSKIDIQVPRKVLSAGWVVALSLLAVYPVAAATLTVNSGPGCSDVSGTPYCTIQAATSAAGTGDTINVAAGTYAELVTVSTNGLQFKGAKAGMDARTPRGSGETIVGTGKGAFHILADNVMLDGFTFQNVSIDCNVDFTALCTPIHTSGANSGQTIVNNIIQNNIIGLYLNSNGANPSLVQHNRFTNNNIPGPAGGTAIYSDQGAVNVTITENSFSGSTDNAILFAGGAGTQSNISITDNVLTGDSEIGFLNTTNSSITGNTSTNSAAHGVYLGGGNDGITISDNTFSVAGSGFSGIRLRNDAIPPAENTNIHILMNTITGSDFGIRIASDALTGVINANFNRIVGNVSGITNEAATSIDATDNWWGCNQGPNNVGCDSTSGAVNYTPWLTLTLDTSPSPVAAVTTISQCDTATLIAEVVMDSNGTDTSGVGHIPDGTSSVQVLFSAVAGQGTVNPAMQSLVNGVATSVFAPTCYIGDTQASAMYDNAQVSVTITIDPGEAMVLSHEVLLASRRGPHGVAILRSYINDNDTGGALENDLLNGTGATIDVRASSPPSPAFSGTLVFPAASCHRQRGPGTAITCRNASGQVSFSPFKSIPLVYHMSMVGRGLPSGQSPTGPAVAILHHGTTCRFDCIDSCRKAGPLGLVCRE